MSFDPTKDRHTQDAARIFGVPISEVTREQRLAAKELTFFERLEEGSRIGLRKAVRAAGVTDKQMDTLTAEWRRVFGPALDALKKGSKTP